MTESAEKIAFRNAFNTKLSKKEAEATYLTRSEYQGSSSNINTLIIAEQLVGFYNGCTGSNLNQRDYTDVTSEQQTTCMNDFVDGYNGVS